MLRIQIITNQRLRNIEQRLKNIESAIKHRALSPVKMNDDLIAPFLPLATLTVIKEFDALLKISSDAVQQFVSRNIL